MKGIIYTRVSSDEQIKGTSLEFQEECCRNYCRNKNIEVVKIFSDKGESAKDLSSKNRKQFLEAIEFCRKNKSLIQAFVILRLDRFARNTLDHLTISKLLSDYGVTLHSVTEPISDGPSGKLIETILASTAEYDNAIRSQRSVGGMQTKINQGIYPWKPPVGYKCAQNKKHGEKKIQPDKPDEQAFPIVQKGLQMYAQELCTLTDLVSLLDKWGLKSLRGGRKTTVQLVDKMLGKYLKFYAGVIHNPWTGEDVDGLHKPMITKEEMFQIQMIRQGKLRKIKHLKKNQDFPLRRAVLCACCSTPLTGSAPRGNGGRYYYYHCQNKYCSMYGKSIPKTELEVKFNDKLIEITPNDKFLALFRATVLDLWQENGKILEIDAKKYEKQLAALEAKKKRDYEMREDGSYTKEEFLERKREIENDIISVQISANEANVKKFDVEAALEYAIDFIGNLKNQWTNMALSLKYAQFQPRFQKLIFPKGISYQRDGKFGTTELGVIFKLNQHFLGADFSQNSTLVPLGGIEPSFNA